MSEKEKVDARPGQNVIAKIGGKEVGPIYFVQIEDGKARLQGSQSHLVPLTDIVRVV